MHATKINANNDRNGNPRRGWVIFSDGGAMVDFVDEGYEGAAALREKYPEFVDVSWYAIPTTPKFYRECLRLASKASRR